MDHLNMSGSQEAMSAVENWRTVAKDTSRDEVIDILSVHADWSRDQLQESLDLYSRLVDCKDSYVAPLIQAALVHLDQAYRLYGPRSVMCSYNGGKDAVVILHLVRAALANYYETNKQKPPERPRVIYFDHKDEFPEILALLRDTVREYDLDMIAFKEGISFGEGLQILVDNNIVPGTHDQVFPCSFVLGTRRTDPNAGNQGHFAPSSSYMPPFMRVNPVLDWTYGHIWHFLRLFKLPYCVLYDQGYTSLGTTKDTRPCPALAVAGSSDTDIPRFWPAYMLQDWDLERAGRIKNEVAPSKLSKPSEKTEFLRSDSQKSLRTHLSTITDLGAAEKTQGSAPISTVTIARMSDEGTTDSRGESFASDGMQRSVGLLIIGDEILKGITADVNTQAAAMALRAQNVPLTMVSVVSDCQESIVAEILRLRRDVDVIITSGGVGPTHDDVTVKSVADALDKEMVFHEGMAKLLKEKMNPGDDPDSVRLTQAQIKMSTLPSNAKLRYLSTDKDDWPTLQCHNIFILPGVPQFFAKKIESLAVYLSSQLERSCTYKVVLSVDENAIVPVLNAVVERHPDVCFGSYPFVGQPDFKTVVTLEARLVEGDFRRNSSLSLAKGTERLTKEKMDRNVKVALDDLINELEHREKGSILRVDNNVGMLFS
jgi:FAD synthetase